MDLDTLLLSAMIVTFVYGCGLYLYGTQQKTYTGFALWTASFFVYFLGYSSLFLRGYINISTSVMVTNLAFATGALMRLDGTSRFIKGSGLKRPIYLLLLPLALSIAIFHFLHPSVAIRNLITCCFGSVASLAIAYLFLKSARSATNNFHLAAGAVTGCMGVFFVLAPLYFVSVEGIGIYQMGNLYYLFYLVILSFEICWGYCLLLINGQRLEDELRNTEQDLRESNLQLEEEMKKRITLSGLLPICSHCKKIRDDKGYWNHLESYIESHSEADFSHSICPECALRLYPDLDLKGCRE